MSKCNFALLAFCLSILAAGPVFADFEAGVEALRNGDRATAFREFETAAQNKDNRAYGKLASMYLYGLGTVKNYQRAYVWFQMAHLAGEREGERYRDAASSMLSRAELGLAEAAAEEKRIELGLPKIPE